MQKYALAFLSGAAVIFQSLLPLAAPADQVTWLRWRLGGLACGALALVFLLLQLRSQYQEETKARLDQEKREKERDKVLQQISAHLPRRRGGYDSAMESAPAPLSTRMKALTEKLLTFLGDVSPSLEETKGRVRPWADAVASGYYQKFEPDLKKLLAEAKNSGVDSGITEADITPSHPQDASGIRGIADRLLATAVVLDSSGTGG
jgi:hypothetical protein